MSLRAWPWHGWMRQTCRPVETNYSRGMIARGDIFKILGRVSVLFSTLEAEIAELLCVLVHQEDPMLAATVLERSPFARNLELLKKVARFRDTRLESRVNRLWTIVTPLNKKRNLFVHGCWDISPMLLDQGKVGVSDSKINYKENKSRKTWRKGTDHVLTYQDLQEYQAEVMRALKMTRELLQALKNKA